MKLPFGIAQIGKAFRNEIVARQFMFRMREFEQMEMQFFCQPGTEMGWFEYWKKPRLAWHEALGMGNENYRYHDHEKLAHYANAATDIEFKHAVRLQGGGGHPHPHQLRPLAAREVQWHEDALFRPRQERELRAVRRGDIHRCGPLFLSATCHAYQEQSSTTALPAWCCRCLRHWALIKCARCCRFRS